MIEHGVALLGRQDKPTDAIEDYCQYLNHSLRQRGFDMKLIRVPWAERGWVAALWELAQQAREWRGQWIFIQYTALSWSRRGFPWCLLGVLSVLQHAGARIAVVFHDAEPYPGTRTFDRVRRLIQLSIMRRAVQSSNVAVFTVPVPLISWVKVHPPNAVFIPVGANLPVSASCSSGFRDKSHEGLRVAIYGITGGEAGKKECVRIVDAMRSAAAKVCKLQLRAFGRNALDFAPFLVEELRCASVDVQVKGILSAEEVMQELCGADVMLFVRGGISSRRGSAIAGIACGLPVVAYFGSETGQPITDAGVMLVSEKEEQELRDALVRVLTDEDFRAQLAKRSRLAQERYFGWPAIAENFVQALSSRS